MHTKYRILVTTLVAAGLALSPALASEHEHPDRDDHQRGGEVEGTETLEQEVKLVATAAAPAGARGEAELEAHNTAGADTAELKLEVEGLPAGTYAVSVTSLADGTTVTPLGTFDVITAAASSLGARRHGRDHAEDDNGGHHEDEGEEDEHEAEDQHVIFGGSRGVPFPAGFNPLDIGVVTISTVETTDANGAVVPAVALLTGDFAKPTNSNFNATVTVESVDPSVNVSGTAMVRARVKNKRSLGERFALAAKGLPANTAVTVTFDGGKSIKAKTSKKGTLGLSKLPVGVRASRLQKVEIKSAPDSAVAKAHF